MQQLDEAAVLVAEQCSLYLFIYFNRNEKSSFEIFTLYSNFKSCSEYC